VARDQAATRWTILLASACAAVLLAGCDDDGDGPASVATPRPTLEATSSASPPVDAGAVAEQEALAAYRAMWQDMVVAARTSDYESPALRRHASGLALQLIVDSLRKDKQDGVVTRGELVLDPRVREASPRARPTRVIVDDCADSARWLKYRASGELANDIPGGRREIRAVVRNLDGAWKVIDFAVEATGSC
jgi:hypothetical protein